MKSSCQDCFVRLVIGALLNFALVALALTLGRPVWGGWEQPFYFHLLAGAVAAVALVIMAPALWRGTANEIVLALFFAAQPVYRLFQVFNFWQEIRWGCCR